MSDARLASEAEQLFTAIFGLAPAPGLGERYRDAHRELGLADDAATAALLERILARKLDVEAIEYALRLRDRHNALTRKIRILHYLAECDPRTVERFYGGDAPARATSLLMLPSYALACWLRGRFLLWRHGLV